MDPRWQLKGTTRDQQSITREWQPINQDLIEDVTVREMANVMTSHGRLTELHRSEWDDKPVGQVFQSVLDPGAITAWHAHEHTLDRLCLITGKLLLALYDAREGSSTFGRLNQFRFGEHRPAMVRVPPRV